MNRLVVSCGLFVEDEGVERIRQPLPVTEYSADHPEKTVQDAQVSKLSEPMITGASTDSGPSMQSPIGLATTSLLTTLPSQPLPRDGDGRDTNTGNLSAESVFESTNLSESIPQSACNDTKMLIDKINIADIQMKDI